jgi:hypothetical protein
VGFASVRRHPPWRPTHMIRPCSPPVVPGWVVN